MTAGEERLSADRILRNAAEEVDDVAVVLGAVERIVCDLAQREPGLAAAHVRELQALDVLRQRLSGLSACLRQVGSNLPGCPIDAAGLAGSLPLEAQRARILQDEGCRAAHPAGASLDLF